MINSQWVAGIKRPEEGENSAVRGRTRHLLKSEIEHAFFKKGESTRKGLVERPTRRGLHPIEKNKYMD